jgi:hypothetical protein
MPLSFWIAVVTSVAVLLLGLVRRVKLREIQILGKIVASNARPKVLQSKNQRETDKRPNLQGEEMTTPTTTRTSHSLGGVDLRRSSRIKQSVPLLILGRDRGGEHFEEKTSAVAINLHGCRYPSRHEYVQDGWITLRVTEIDGTYSPVIRARVRSVFSAQTPRELCQVGVELDTPGNVWGIRTPPEDWQRLLGASDSFAAAAVAVVPAPETSTPPTSFDGKQSTPPERTAEVRVLPGPLVGAAPGAEAAPAKEPAPAKTDRIVITSEQVLQALKAQIQLAADRAVQASISAQLDQAVKPAFDKIEDSWRANVHQIEKFTADRIAEIQKLWEKQLVAHRAYAEEVSGRLQALAHNSQQTLVDAQKFVERLANETSPQLHARLIDSVDRANSELEAKATQVFGQHLARLEEGVQLASREARSQLNESIAEALSRLSPPGDSVSPEYVESLVQSSREQILGHLEERLEELYASLNRQNDLARHRIEEIASQLESLTNETSQARSRHDQGLAEVRSLLVNMNTSVTQERLDSLVTCSREQILSHLEWRLGEVSGKYEKMLDEACNHVNKFAEHFEKLSSETRDHLAEAKNLADRVLHEFRPPDLSIIERSLGHATKEFEAAAARVSDRELVRLIEQKQAVSREVSLELEARTGEARGQLQKFANSTLEEFRRRAELQIDLIFAEAKDRITSSIASLDAESRTAIEMRRRALETDVTRAAEQSAMEFRSGIKAFLYSCLVAAVGAVDQHAQTTLAGLATDPGSLPRAVANTGDPSQTPHDHPAEPNDLSPSQ